MIHTAEEYAHKVATFDQDRINAIIDRIPSNINRAGKTYRRLVTKIRKEYDTRTPKIQGSLRHTLSHNV